ncbi:MAG TPA: hypothetical protein VH598_06885, partial [Verrucomicrobiae bacterium]|nr:hypothetical protein [Verrucomicrobiae bacterium]
CCMGRITNVYAAKFRRILEQFGARNLDAGIQRLLASASRLREQERVSDAEALSRIHARLLESRKSFLKIQKGERIGSIQARESSQF